MGWKDRAKPVEASNWKQRAKIVTPTQETQPKKLSGWDYAEKSLEFDPSIMEEYNKPITGERIARGTTNLLPTAGALGLGAVTGGWGAPAGAVGGEYLRSKIMGDEVSPTNMTIEGLAASVPILPKVIRGIGGSYSKAVNKAKNIITGEKAVDIAADAKNISESAKAQNIAYKKAGLPELTPGQMQTIDTPNITPLQATEAKLEPFMTELQSAKKAQQAAVEAGRNKYMVTGRENAQQVSDEIVSPFMKAKTTSGAAIGDFKKAGSEIPIEPNKIAKPFNIDGTEAITFADQTAEMKKLVNEYNNLKNAGEVAAFQTRVKMLAKGASRTGNSQYARKLSTWVDEIEDGLASTLENSGIARPKEAYKTYKAVKDYEKGLTTRTMSGEKVPIDNVVQKITKSKAELDAFIDASTKIGDDSVVKVVKEEYIKDIISGKNWISKWRKAYNNPKTRSVVETLMPPNEIAFIEQMANYAEIVGSTTARAVNPSLTEASRDVKQIMADVLLGKTGQQRALIKEYQKIMGITPTASDLAPRGQKTIQTIMYPARKTGSEE
jgi:hypothetical protein